MINKVHGAVSQKHGYKFLTVGKGDTVLKMYNQVFSGLKCHIKKIDDNEVVYNPDFDKTQFITEDSLPLKKLIYFPILALVIRCIFKQNGVFYHQVYLDDALYQL